MGYRTYEHPDIERRRRDLLRAAEPEEYWLGRVEETLECYRTAKESANTKLMDLIGPSLVYVCRKAKVELPASAKRYEGKARVERTRLGR